MMPSYLIKRVPNFKLPSTVSNHAEIFCDVLLTLHLLSGRPPLKDLTVNHAGKVLDTHGNVIAKLVSSSPNLCTGENINSDNIVVDNTGVTIGHVSLLSDIKWFPPDGNKGTKGEQQEKKHEEKIVEPKEEQYAFWDHAPNSKCYASFCRRRNHSNRGSLRTPHASQPVPRSWEIWHVRPGLESSRRATMAYGSGTKIGRDVTKLVNQVRWHVRRAHGQHQWPAVQEKATTAEMVNWRWQRFEYSPTKENLKVAIQWMVRDHIVLQQWIVKNDGPDNRRVSIEFGRDMWIQDLEYLDYFNQYNGGMYAENGQYGTKGPHGYGWVLMHSLDEPMREATSNGYPTLCPASIPKDEKTTAVGRDSTKKNKNGCENSIATGVMAIFVDGSAREFVRSDPIGPEIVKGHQSLEITEAYKMILVPKTAIDYRNFVIPASAANVTRFITEEIPTRIHSLSTIDLGYDHIGADLNKSNRLPKENNKAAVRDSGASATTHIALEEARRIFRPSGCPKTSSLRTHIDFAVWRNLEYILSVCAITLKPPSLMECPKGNKPGEDKSEIMAVALTCGDASGHRLCNSASLWVQRDTIRKLSSKVD